MITTLEEAPVRADGEPHWPETVVQAAEKAGVDLDALAREREERFQERYARHTANDSLDPHLRELYLDRTILTTRQQREQLGDITPYRLWLMRGGRGKIRGTSGSPKPGDAIRYPSPDTVEGFSGGAVDFGVEIGRMREWEVITQRKVWNPVSRQLDKARASRHGNKHTE